MLMLSVLILSAAAIAAPVRVEQGLLAGAPGTDPSVTVYKGVPFAAPPVGELRWRAPRPALPWQGVRKADQFGPNCIQVMRDGLGPWTKEYQAQGTTSEDCLHLNIWTAARSAKEKRPVLVYFHGGAFTDGSGNVPVYDGEGLAKKGIVVVTVNYRVGVLGFMAHPELTKESERKASGNYGLLDQVAALEWVKKNIAAFGGDPAQVTIGGQSAGASSVHALTASPLAKGLFIRAMPQSGSNVRQGRGQSLADAEKAGVKYAESKGATTLAALRALTPDQILAGGTRFFPIVDGWFLPKSADEIFAAGEGSDVPTLTGWCADEGSFNDDYGKLPAAEFRKRMTQQAGAQAEEILKLYATASDAESAESQKAVSRDRGMVSMYLWATNHKSKVYTYFLTHETPGPTQGRYGAFHSSELPYVFDNLRLSNRPWTEADRKIAATMSQYWANFIKTGDPNGKGLPKWPAVSATEAQTMELGDKMGPRPIASQEKLEIWKKLLAGSGR
jgi:para-nitrobenzyl esterase